MRLQAKNLSRDLFPRYVRLKLMKWYKNYFPGTQKEYNLYELNSVPTKFCDNSFRRSIVLKQRGRRKVQNNSIVSLEYSRLANLEVFHTCLWVSCWISSLKTNKFNFVQTEYSLYSKTQPFWRTQRLLIVEVPADLNNLIPLEITF